MSRPKTFLARCARTPLPILLGTVLGFLGCCWAGRWVASHHRFENFTRFHAGIAPETLFYPTISQSLNTARGLIQPGKVVVLIGGNSILHGVGQRESEMWSKKLQELLGDRYIVMNFAMRGSYSHEFAGVIAPILLAEGVPLIYLTTASDAVSNCLPRDGNNYPNHFWDAWGKSLLPPDERQDAWTSEKLWETAATESKQAERRLRGWFDGVTYSCDLWNYVAYRFDYGATFWTPLKYYNWTQAHRKMTDGDPGSTFDNARFFAPAVWPGEMAILRAKATGPTADAILNGKDEPALRQMIDDTIPEILRSRMIMYLRLESAFYVKMLTPEERERYLRYYITIRDMYRRAGVASEVVAIGYEEADYFDRSHFSEQGGRKLAAEVAPQVRAMAQKLYPNLLAGDAR